MENGADAVYLGGKSFGARAHAANFTRQELGEALSYAHQRGVRVYVTVNTLVDNGEFGELSEFLLFLYREGVDALLVQDLGVIGWARRVLPDLPLHGSTQMTVHNAAGVQFLAGLGLRRLVLAREVSYGELLDIRRQTGLELEVFVHGALCISYSGQCLFSSMVGGRSGNRGSCAQPCRLAYALADGRGAPRVPAPGCPLQRARRPAGVHPAAGGTGPGLHLLSTRDLMLLAELLQLVRAGVSALKIEGRMKRPEYVATVVRIYRQALDRACLDPEGYRVSEEEVRDLAQIFNRDFTTGYFYGRPGALRARELMSHTRPNNRGLYLGRVLRTTAGGGVVIRTRLPLRAGDGIEFWTQRGSHEGITVHGLLLHGAATGDDAGAGGRHPVDGAEPGSEVEVTVPSRRAGDRVSPGDRVFKTHDSRLIEEARLSFTRPGRLKTPVRVRARGRRGEPLELEAVDPDGNRAAARGTIPGEAALKHPLTEDVVRAQVERLGNTPFTLAGLDCDLDGVAMYPLSELNEVRRALTAALEQARLDRFRRVLDAGQFEAAEAEFWSSLRQDAGRISRAPGARARVPASAGAAPGARAPGRRPLLAVAVADRPSLAAALEGGAGAVYFGGLSYRGREAWSPDAAAQDIELCHDHGARACLIMPRIWKEGDRSGARAWLAAAARWPADGVVAGDLGGLTLALQSGLQTIVDFSIPVFNDPAVQLLLRQGAARLALSPELNREQLRRLSFLGSPCLELVVHGTLPLMVSEHCVVEAAAPGAGGGPDCSRQCGRRPWSLVDRQGYRFPLQLDEHCRMTLYNARELCLIEHLGDIIQGGYGSLRLELRSHEAGDVREITGIYRRALTAACAGDWSGSAVQQARERLERLSEQGLTRGHYLRGVIEKQE